MTRHDPPFGSGPGAETKTREVGEVPHIRSDAGRASPPTLSPPESGTTAPQRADPRLALLLRASAMVDLVEAGLLDIDDAVDGLVHAVHMIAPCPCERATLAAWERRDLETRRRCRRAWRGRRR
jgi:hypothetical protein